MIIYKVKIEKLSKDWGRFIGWETYGYFSTKEKAAAKIAELEATPYWYMEHGEARIDKIEVE